MYCEMHTAINKIAEDKAREKTKGIPIHYSVKKNRKKMLAIMILGTGGINKRSLSLGYSWCTPWIA